MRQGYRVVVNVEIPQQFEITVYAADADTAARAVLANWETVYHRQALQIGAAPSRVSVLMVEATGRVSL